MSDMIIAEYSGQRSSTALKCCVSSLFTSKTKRGCWTPPPPPKSGLTSRDSAWLPWTADPQSLECSLRFLWLNLSACVYVAVPLPWGPVACFGLVSEVKLWWLKYAVSTQGEAIDLQQVFLWCSVFELSAVRSLADALLCFRRTLWYRLAGFHGDRLRSRGEEVWCAGGRLPGDGRAERGLMLSFWLIWRQV